VLITTTSPRRMRVPLSAVATSRTVHEDALPRTKAAVLDQPLPRGQARHHEGRTHGEVNVARQRCEVACLDGYILRQRAVPSNLFAINKSSLLMAS